MGANTPQHDVGSQPLVGAETRRPWTVTVTVTVDRDGDGKGMGANTPQHDVNTATTAWA